MPKLIEEPPRRRPPYFWWLLANLLALCFAVLSWTVCLHVFGNPEIPRNYEIMRRLGRLPTLSRYWVLNVPNGNLLDPKGLYGPELFQLTGDDLHRLDAQIDAQLPDQFQTPAS